MQPLALAIAMIATVNLLGVGRENRWKKTDKEVTILAVQGNIGNFDKLMAEKGRGFREPIVRKYIDLSRAGLIRSPETDLMLWPETAFPDVLDLPYLREANALSVRNFVIESHVPLVTGSYSYQASNKNTYNGIFYVDTSGATPLPPYRKSILLVFGETFPFSDVIPYMKWLFPDQGGFGRGDGPTVLNVNGKTGERIRLGPQICYEGLYPWFSAGLAQKGAQIITNVTNDSWFGDDFEPYQHLFMTLARGIEFRRPLIRSTNTGITTAILASGEILTQSPVSSEWTGAFHIPYQNDPDHTFYEHLAGRWIYILVVLFMVLILLGRRSRSAR